MAARGSDSLHALGALSVKDIEHEPFPAPSKVISGTIGGVPTDVTSLTFGDKIMITISQSGRLSQWVHRLFSMAQERS
jgi:hypothetical protein